MKKSPQALTTKLATAFQHFVDITLTLRYVFSGNCSLNRLNP